MIGIIPMTSQTFEVFGDFNMTPLVEGKLYYHPDTKKLYYYSSTLKRPNPTTGFFPIWDGNNIYESKHSIDKYLSDVLRPDISQMSKNISNEMARSIRYRQRLSENNKKLNPQLNDEDNFFTQIIKSIISQMNITKVDLLDMSSDIISDRMIENYYSSLTKVTMMRLDKFHIWIDKILHLHYEIKVFKEGKEIIKYSWPKDKFDTGMVKYNSIIDPSDDPYKRIIKILMVKENISKSTLRTEDVDDYTINNMMTTLHSSKALSAQLFSRFMRMANIEFEINVFDCKDNTIFTYKE